MQSRFEKPEQAHGYVVRLQDSSRKLMYVDAARGLKGPEINLIEWLGPGVNCRFVVRFSSFLVGIVATRFPIGVIYAGPDRIASTKRFGSCRL